MENIKSYFFDPYIVKCIDHNAAWEPTPHGIALAQGMTKVPYTFCGKSMIEIGTGSGIHAILALKLGARYMDVTDIEASILEEAKINAKLNNTDFRNLWVKDWFYFDPQEEKYDFVLCNPPFAKAEKGKRRYFISEMIKCSRNFLNRGGHLIFCQSSMANFKETERELTRCGFDYKVIHQARGPFRDYYFTEEDFIKEAKEVKNGFDEIDEVLIENLQVYLCTVK